jgi:hypothetical protein
VGAQEHLPCRVLFVRLPEEVVNRRRQKANEKARRKGRTLSPRYLKLLAWNIYITNVPVEMLTIRQAVVLYSLRWQVELIFKLWKSQCKLDRVAGLRRERVLCELYAKMIGVVMTHFFMAPLRLTKECELSLVKARQTFQRNAMSLAKAIGQLAQLTQAIETLCSRILKFGLKNKRKKAVSAPKWWGSKSGVQITQNGLMGVSSGQQFRPRAKNQGEAYESRRPDGIPS